MSRVSVKKTYKLYVGHEGCHGLMAYMDWDEG